MNPITTRVAQCIVLIALASSSALSQASAGDRDSSAFVAVVRSIVRDTSFTREGLVQIDPRPMLAGGLAAADRRLFASMLAHRVRARRDALRALDIPIGNVRHPKNCAGVMTPYSPETHKGCPKKDEQVMSIGVPRDSVAGAEREGRHLLVARTVLAGIGPTGVSYLYFDYVLEPIASGWKVTKSALVSFVE